MTPGNTILCKFYNCSLSGSSSSPRNTPVVQKLIKTPICSRKSRTSRRFDPYPPTVRFTPPPFPLPLPPYPIPHTPYPIHNFLTQPAGDVPDPGDAAEHRAGHVAARQRQGVRGENGLDEPEHFRDRRVWRLDGQQARLLPSGVGHRAAANRSGGSASGRGVGEGRGDQGGLLHHSALGIICTWYCPR